MHAVSCGIPVDTLKSNTSVDVMIDSANEVDMQLNILKGENSAFLIEKMIANIAKQYVCVVDETKLTKYLGPHAPIAVEIVPYGYESTLRNIQELSSLKGVSKTVLRRGTINSRFPDGNNIAATNTGHYIIDIYFEKPISNLSSVLYELNHTNGVIEHSVVHHNKHNKLYIQTKIICLYHTRLIP